MTTIFSIDPAMQAWQQDGQRPPAKDFAHELAKRDEQAKADPANEAQARAPSDEPSWSAPATSGAPAMPDTTGPATQAEAAPAWAEAQRLAQVEVTPVGVTEALLGARVFGWHAMAQSYLSELSAADDAADKPAATEASAATLAPPPPEAAPASSTATTAATLDTGTAAMPQAAESAPACARAPTGESTSSNAAEITAADAAAPDYWSERSLRYTRQRDGASVAWLRDYRLGDTQAKHLIQWVLSDAKAKGVALSKIMLNGREAWASPDAQ